jgi:hypothetical protein
MWGLRKEYRKGVSLLRTLRDMAGKALEGEHLFLYRLREGNLERGPPYCGLRETCNRRL